VSGRGEIASKISPAQADEPSCASSEAACAMTTTNLERKGGFQMQANDTHLTLLDYLQSEIRKHQRYSLVRRLIVLALLFVAVSLGALVVVNVGTKWFTADQLSALTGLSGLLLAFLRLGRFQEQARWNKIKQRKFEALHRRLTFEGVEDKVISAELTRINEELEQIRIWVEVPTEVSLPVPNAQRDKSRPK
jgi:hypothetical protein